MRPNLASQNQPVAGASRCCPKPLGEPRYRQQPEANTADVGCMDVAVRSLSKPPALERGAIAAVPVVNVHLPGRHSYLTRPSLGSPTPVSASGGAVPGLTGLNRILCSAVLPCPALLNLGWLQLLIEGSAVVLTLHLDMTKHTEEANVNFTLRAQPRSPRLGFESRTDTSCRWQSRVACKRAKPAAPGLFLVVPFRERNIPYAGCISAVGQYPPLTRLLLFLPLSVPMPLPVQGRGLSSPAGFEEVLLTSWRAECLAPPGFVMWAS